MSLLSSRFIKPATLVLVVLSLMACGGTTTIVQGGGGSPTAPAATATSTATPAPTATATPAPGVCNAADFPTKTNGGPGGFNFPPLTYYYDETPGAGNHPYLMCSSGNPTSILAFMKSSVTAAGWKVVSTTATTLSAQQPTNPPSGYCYEDDITVGQYASYPGEWGLNEHPPIPPCQ